MNTKLLLVKFKTKEKIDYNLVHKIRGYLGNKFSEIIEMHNHENNTSFKYSYPIIQYKSIQNNFHILAMNKGISILYSLIPQLNEFVINNKTIKIEEISIKNFETDVKVDKDFHVYKFDSPYFAFNQENYRKYKNIENNKEKNEFINRILTGNILSYLKSMGIWVEEKIYADFYLDKAEFIKFKETNLIGLKGEFVCNINLPDYIGLGKSVSKGNGVILKKQ